MNDGSGTADPDNQWLATALADRLRSDLQADEALRVIPGDRIARARRDLGLTDDHGAAPLSAQTIERLRGNLDADYRRLRPVHDGAGDALHVEVTLHDARTGKRSSASRPTARGAGSSTSSRRWTSRSARSSVCRDPSAAESTAARAASPGTPEAARAYAEGESMLIASDFRGALASFQRAVAADPAFPLAHSGWRWRRARSETTRRRSSREKGVRGVVRSLPRGALGDRGALTASSRSSGTAPSRSGEPSSASFRTTSSMACGTRSRSGPRGAERSVPGPRRASRAPRPGEGRSAESTTTSRSRPRRSPTSGAWLRRGASRRRRRSGSARGAWPRTVTTRSPEAHSFLHEEDAAIPEWEKVARGIRADRRPPGRGRFAEGARRRLRRLGRSRAGAADAGESARDDARDRLAVQDRQRRSGRGDDALRPR